MYSWLTSPYRWRGVRRIGPTLLVLLLLPTLVSQVRAQVGEDVAYPQNLTEWKWFETAATRRQTTFKRMPGLSPEYRLGPGDQLDVNIIGQAVSQVQVGTDGTINVPMAGYVKVADLTAEEAEQTITEALREKDLIRNPQVLIFITEYFSKRVYSIGEVDLPGEYVMSYQMTLMDLIFLSGGIDFTAARYGYLHRRPANGKTQWRPSFVDVDLAQLQRQPDFSRDGAEVVRIDLQPMKEGGVLEKNIALKAGDVFYVPRQRIDLAYVIGDVPSAGAFNLPTGVRMTAAQVIAWAGGPRKTAKMKDGILVRLEVDGSRREIPVDFAAILTGRQPDVEVKPDDIIFIPGSGSKTLGVGLLNTVPSIVSRMLLLF